MVHSASPSAAAAAPPTEGLAALRNTGARTKMREASGSAEAGESRVVVSSTLSAVMGCFGKNRPDTRELSFARQSTEL